MHNSYESQPRLRPIPQQRVIEKMDWYMSRRDYAGAERHLLYWLEEARGGNDLRGELMLRNELVGHYRKTANREGAMASAEAALELIDPDETPKNIMLRAILRRTPDQAAMEKALAEYHATRRFLLGEDEGGR